MSDVEARLQVLRMIEAGRLTAAEGARLLASLGRDAGRPAAGGRAAPRWLRVRVIGAGTGHPHVDVTVPYLLARALAGLVERLVPRGVPELEALWDAVGDAIDAGRRGPVFETTDARGDRIEIVVE